MGIELRRVPPGWEHPRKENGLYQPLYDKHYADACAIWAVNNILWKQGKHPEQQPGGIDENHEWPQYSDYEDRPNPNEYIFYRKRSWKPEEATAYQIYETVSKGTPISPVFLTEAELFEYITTIGICTYVMPAVQAKRWIESGGLVPMFIVKENVIKPGLQAFEVTVKDES